jgi:uncharacterized protein (DUF488 family)
MQFYTIGVFNSSASEFFQQLVDQQIDTFCDIRQRRAVRGSHYAFVNSKRLQEKLASLGIRYLYVQDLAPTAAIRSIQKTADVKNAVTNTHRQALEKAFVKAYETEILDQFDFATFLATLESMDAKRIAFFCVEENPDACHRSLVLSRLNTLNKA